MVINYHRTGNWTCCDEAAETGQMRFCTSLSWLLSTIWLNPPQYKTRMCTCWWIEVLPKEKFSLHRLVTVPWYPDSKGDFTFLCCLPEEFTLVLVNRLCIYDATDCLHSHFFLIQTSRKDELLVFWKDIKGTFQKGMPWILVCILSLKHVTV